MIRNIQALGLAFLAIAALSASAAQAAEGDDTAVITAQNSPGTQHTLTIGTTTIHCKHATLEGTVNQAIHTTQLTANEIEVTPTYQECTGFGGIAVTVQTHGCKFTIKGTATLTGEGGVTGCTEGKQITIKSQACTIFIGNQEGDLSHITFTNNAETETEKHHLQDHVTVTGIKYTTNKQFLCPQAATAEYKGTTTIKAYDDLGSQPVTKHEHQYDEIIEGDELGILGKDSEAHITSRNEVHITTEKDKAVITGHGETEVLKIGGTTVECETATFEGTVKQAIHTTQLTTTEIAVTPTYQGCTGFGGIAVTVQTHGCKFTIKGTATLTGEGGVTGCTEGKQITIKSSACTVFIGNQEGDLSHITFTNNAETETEKHHLQDHVTVTGIKYTTNKQFLCPQAATAEYKGTTTIKAYADAGTEEVTLHGHQYVEHLCGKVVGILAT